MACSSPGSESKEPSALETVFLPASSVTPSIVTNNRVTLSWVERNSEAVVSSSVQRKLTGEEDSAYSSIPLSSGETTYTDRGLEDATGYTYRIKTVYLDTIVYSAAKEVETHGPYYFKMGEGAEESVRTFSFDIIIDAENNRSFEFSEFNETLPPYNPIYNILSARTNSMGQGIARATVMQFAWDAQEVNDLSFSYPVEGGDYTDPDGRQFVQADPSPHYQAGMDETLWFKCAMPPVVPIEKTIATIKGFINPPQAPRTPVLESADFGGRLLFTPGELSSYTFGGVTFIEDKPDFYLVEASDDGGATWHTLDLIPGSTNEETISYEIPQRAPAIDRLRLKSSNLAGYSEAVELSVELTVEE